jgi:RNA polymerase sigma-70 factor (ECF subfamily)
LVDTTRPSLLIRIRNRGDHSAWSEFDSIYRPLLRRFARARGLSETETDEIAQQCMAAVDRYIGSFQYDPKRGRFKSWLATMVGNRVKNALRDRRDAQARTGDLAELREQGSSPEEMFDTLWRQEHLRHCLRMVKAEVEESTFDAFVAHVIEERSIEDVCREFAMTRNQVHAIKSRMTRRLRRRMVDLLGEEE